MGDFLGLHPVKGDLTKETREGQMAGTVGCFFLPVLLATPHRLPKILEKKIQWRLLHLSLADPFSEACQHREYITAAVHPKPFESPVCSPPSLDGNLSSPMPLDHWNSRLPNRRLVGSNVRAKDSDFFGTISIIADIIG